MNSRIAIKFLHAIYQSSARKTNYKQSRMTLKTGEEFLDKSLTKSSIG